MNREDIIRMAQEANIWIADGWEKHGTTVDELIRFAKVVASAEREACVKACEYVITNDWEGAVDCANAIRARGQA
jgi:hypothetical protein